MARATKIVAMAAVGVVGGGAIACVGDLVASVWFNSTGPDLALPPSPLIVRTWGEQVTRAASADGADDPLSAAQDQAREERTKRRTENLAAAERALDVAPTPPNLLAAARAAAAQAELKGEDEDSARDRSEAYALAAKTSTRLLTAYRVMRARVDAGSPGPTLPAIPGDPLEGNLLYLAALRQRGAARVRLLERAASISASPRREPALIMIARTLLAAERPTPAEIARARAALDRIKAPRFAWSVRGWRARADLLSGSPAKALAGYLRQFDAAVRGAAATNAAASIRATLPRLGASGANAFRAEMRRDASLLRPYLAYRVRHTTLSAADRIGLYGFAREFGGAGRVGGDLRARLAEMAMLAGDAPSAKRDAEAALAAGTREAALANYVLGGLAMRAGDDRGAESYFRTAAAGTSAYAVGALEPLALILERTGRRGEALDLYRRLGYTEDQAWLLDVRMDPAEIEAYERTLPTEAIAWRDLVRYSLGMRYLRLARYDDAEKAFQSLGERRTALAQAGSTEYAWNPDGERKPKTDTLFDPLATARELRAMKTKAEGLADREARSAAWYEMASYVYTRRNLLFYNAPLWQGGRAWMLGVFWNEKLARSDDREARLRSAYEHESLQQARAILLRIVREDGEAGTRTTPKAMYRAAVAERRLADLNPQWRDISKYRENLWSSASSRLDELARRFPDDPLAPDAEKFAAVFRREAKGEPESALVGSDPTSRRALIRSRR